MKNILFELILLTCSLCYTKFFNVGTNTDIQPYYFIFCFLYIILISFIKKRLKIINLKIIFLILFLFIFTFFIELFLYEINAVYFRGIYAYISFLLIFITFINLYYNFSIKLIEKRIKFYYWLWNIIGFIQLFDKYFFTSWTNRVGTNLTRGSISLGSEPFYYAVHLILISLVLYVINKNNQKYLLYSFIPILFFAKSSQGLIYLFVSMLIIFFKKENLFYYCIFGMIFFIFLPIGFSFLKGTRIHYLFINLLENPKYILTHDGSIGIRIVQWIILLKGTIQNLFLPNGFNKWNNFFEENLITYSKIFQWITRKINSQSNITNKIGSMLGAMLFEMGGIFTLVFYGYLYKIFRKKYIKIYLVVLLLSIHGLNLTNPYVAILIANIYIKSKIRSEKKYEFFNNYTAL